MPINGLTTNVEPRLPLIARFFKGEVKQDYYDKRTGQTKKIAGKELDYFRVEFAPEYAYLESAFAAKYGDQLRELRNVYMLGDRLDDCFSTWNEEYSAQRLLVRCDGARKIKEWNEKLERYESETDLCDALPRRDENGVMQQHECGCKRVGRLSFMLPEFMAQTGVVGYFLLTTHSFNDIKSLYDVISFVERSLQATELGELDRPVSGVPFVLGRVTREISYPSRDKETNKLQQKKVKKSLLYMQVEPEYLKGLVQAKLHAANQFGPMSSLPDSLAKQIDSGKFEVPSARVEVDYDQLSDSDIAVGDEFSDLPDGFMPNKQQILTPPANVKPKDDLGKNAALRNRFMSELKELGITPKQALDTLGLTSFEGWTREGVLDALKPVNRQFFQDQGASEGEQDNEPDDLAF